MDGFEDRLAELVGIIESHLNGLGDDVKEAFLLHEDGNELPAALVGQDDLVERDAAGQALELLPVGLGRQGVVALRVLQQVVVPQVAPQSEVPTRLQLSLLHLAQGLPWPDYRDQLPHPPVQLRAGRAKEGAQTNRDEHWLLGR